MRILNRGKNVSKRERNAGCLGEDKQKEDYVMFFSGLNLAQPAKQGIQIFALGTTKRSIAS